MQRLLTLNDIEIQRQNILKNTPKNLKPYTAPLIKRILYSYLKCKRKFRRNTDTKTKLSIEEIQRVLLFRYDALGDYIVSTPVVSFLKQNNPNIIIDVVTSTRNDAFVQLDKNISNTYIIDRNIYNKQTKHSIKQMKENNYDIIFALMYTKNTHSADLAYQIAPNAHIIAYSAPDRAKLYGKLFDTLIITTNYDSHHTERMFKSIQAYFGSHHSITDYPIYIPLQATSNMPDGKYIIINLTSSKDINSINEDIGTKIATDVAKHYSNYHVFITGYPSMKELIDAVVNNVNSENCSALLVPFSDYIAILSNAALLITSDSAPVHIAAAANVPIVSIFVVDISIFEWHPYRTDFRMIYADNINEMDTSMVIIAAKQLLH
ncbi:MAG: hypothetical protein LBO69_03125 [Ignavibacteria bacterium]|jgi:ADP-heptose:LPS heptosyltransferase|nr:hypothetical protein [Ignavibacteria bacterium]